MNIFLQINKKILLIFITLMTSLICVSLIIYSKTDNIKNENISFPDIFSPLFFRTP